MRGRRTAEGGLRRHRDHNSNEVYDMYLGTRHAHNMLILYNTRIGTAVRSSWTVGNIALEGFFVFGRYKCPPNRKNPIVFSTKALVSKLSTPPCVSPAP